jgi:hypothetical protein
LDQIANDMRANGYFKLADERRVVDFEENNSFYGTSLSTGSDGINHCMEPIPT